MPPTPKAVPSSSSGAIEAAATQPQTAPPFQSAQYKQNSHRSLDPMSSFLAGIAGGASSTILLYPLDLIKVRMQVDENNRRRSAGSNTNPKNSAATSRSICTTVRGVIKYEGYLGLYRGLTPALVGSAASWGGFFIIYEELKLQMLQLKRQRSSSELLHQTALFSPPSSTLSTSQSSATLDDGGQYVMYKDMHVGEEIDINTNYNSNHSNNNQQHNQSNNDTFATITLGPTEHFAASCLAGACMVAITNPLWLIKTRLQLQNSKLHQQLISSKAVAVHEQVKPPYRGLIHAAFTIVKEEGILALYKGSVPALLLVSHGGFQFVTYEYLKGHFATFVNGGENKGERSRNNGRRRIASMGERLRDSLGYLIMGAVSKFVASTTTYPLQVIKSRLQQRSQVIEFSETSNEIVVVKRDYAGVIDCITKIWRNEGIVGFFKGCVTNALRVMPSAAITFVTYEFVLDVLTEGH